MLIEPDFSPLARTLRLVRLSVNPWGRVPVSLYNATYHRLRGIYLGWSQITDVPVEAFRSWPHVVVLSVSNNLINCINDMRNTTKEQKLGSAPTTIRGIVVHAC